ncbi:Ig-like domain-containing protein, partial [Vibrio chagasii]|uniref:Ig-like domain-containing protein n=1 Tax=Vibrio chagasii TaxID=170679 RepID=UPI00354FAC13
LATGESSVITYSYDVVEKDDEGNVLGTTSTTATITITGENDGAVVSGVSTTATESDAAYSLNLLSNSSDADASDELSVANVVKTGGDDSGITVNADGTLSIDPNAYNA